MHEAASTAEVMIAWWEAHGTRKRTRKHSFEDGSEYDRDTSRIRSIPGSAPCDLNAQSRDERGQRKKVGGEQGHLQGHLPGAGGVLDLLDGDAFLAKIDADDFNRIL